ncbi:MAG: 5-amino-6-(D-ribitylamino)uracil--L-tyrosine 4-hydroxyphenyl transferase CofH [Pseudomonadales bacterium]
MDSPLPLVLLEQAVNGHPPTEEQSHLLAGVNDLPALMQAASTLRDQGFGPLVTYSRKVFIPLTHLCRDVCHYCTFAKTPSRIEQPFMSVDEVLALVREGAVMGCKEALFTLGEKPELRYKAAREALAEMGFSSTLEYVAHVAEAVFEETGMFPHINAGCMDDEEIMLLRKVSASMGIMLESCSERLCQKGMPHYGSPDKDPAVRIATLERAGQHKVPFTSGILIGIGETRLERIESLLALRDVHRRYGHIQEIIIQNFRAKPDTKMAQAPEPDLEELLWTIAVARILFGAQMSIQAPPNLSPGVLEQLVAAGINDWGGVSPLTPDHVNPEAPWPHVDTLARETRVAGKLLQERLTIYPAYAQDGETWLDSRLRTAVLRSIDGQGYPRTDDWLAGEASTEPAEEIALIYGEKYPGVSNDVRVIVAKAEQGLRLQEDEISRLFQTRGGDFAYVCQAADSLRQKVSGDTVRYVVNRNINYTNVCYFRCTFCAFSKGKASENLRGKSYDLSADEIGRRVKEAWDRGATEVCMQGGIHPDYTGESYLDICRIVKSAVPDMHIHAFSPLEVWQGAQTLGVTLSAFLQQLKEVGLSTLPGTAAEILDDEIRAVICHDKLNTAQWLEVIETSHQQGFRTTATIMYGHVEGYQHWARHLLAIRDLQERTGGFTEFVPLPFVASEAPMFSRGQSRRGPTFRESVLMHAVSRLVFNGQIDNIQTSWVKMGHEGVKACLNSGANDMGGTLMNESITRAAGAVHGQEMPPQVMDELIESIGRKPVQRTTLYGEVPQERQDVSYAAGALTEIENTAVQKRKKGKVELIRLQETA